MVIMMMLSCLGLGPNGVEVFLTHTIYIYIYNYKISLSLSLSLNKDYCKTITLNWSCEITTLNTATKTSMIWVLPLFLSKFNVLVIRSIL